MKRDPLMYACPQCGVASGVRCLSGTRFGARLKRGSHRGRVRRSRGENVPDSFEVFLKRAIRDAIVTDLKSRGIG